MKYRTKLLLFSIALVALTCALVQSVAFRGGRQLVVEQIQRNVKLIAADAASRVDVALHEAIRKPGEEASLAYLNVERALRKVRNRYRQEGFDVSYIYTVRPAEDGSGNWIYVVDAEERGEMKSMIGDAFTYEADNPLDAKLDLVPYAYADRDFTHDAFGSWLSGNAPLKDGAGKVVGMVGIDIRADDVMAETNLVFSQAALAGSLALLVGIGGSIGLARWATAPLSEIVAALARIGKGKLSERVAVTRKDEFAELGLAVNTMAQALEQQLALKGALSRHVSRDFSRQILSARKLPESAGHEQEVTVLFCDIRNFEVLADSLNSDEVVAFLNEYFRVMVDSVFSNGGTLDKFTGDGFMATFGAVGDACEHRASAVRAAVLLHREHTQLATGWRADGAMPLHLGIGIHSGFAKIEDALESSNMSYFATGEAVEMAARVEGLNRRLGTACLISGTTKRGLERHFDFVGVSEIPGMGGEETLSLFTLREMVECPLPEDSGEILTA